MQLIKQEKFNKEIKENFDYGFNIEKRGLYVIFITASCRSGDQTGEKGGEDLRVEIDGIKLREVPAVDKPQYKNIPSAWNGTKLKGLKKIVIFILWLEKENHKITFVPYKGARLENIKIKLIENTSKIKFNLEEQALNGDRRPWYTFVLINLPLKQITAKITTKWRFPDSDDVKLIIDNEIQKPEGFFSKWRNWLWSGSIFKKLFQKETQTKIVEPNLSQGLHYIEFHADKMPTLHNVELDFGEEGDFRIKAKVVWGYTHLRKEPTIKSEAIVEKVNKGEQVVILGKAVKGERYKNEANDKLLSTNRWHKVEYKGKTGFIYSLALEIEREDKESIQKIIIEKTKDFGLDPEILLSLAQCEASFFPYTVSFDEKRSEIAFGVMQISGDLLNDLEDYFNLEQNIQRGVSYFNDQYNKKYKDDKDRLRKSVAAYNAGPGHVEVDGPLELEVYDPETQRIVNCVQGHLKKRTFKKILKSLAKVGLGLFLIFQLVLFCEALFESKNEVIFYSGINSATNLIEKENLDVKPIDPSCIVSGGDYMGEEFCKEYKEWAGWE